MESGKPVPTSRSKLVPASSISSALKVPLGNCIEPLVPSVKLNGVLVKTTAVALFVSQFRRNLGKEGPNRSFERRFRVGTHW
jgi:hypothetical protein